MAQGIRLKIDVSKIDKTKMFKGQKGTYLDITVWERQEPDDYGNTHSVEQDMGKEHREAGGKKNYIGSGKFIGLGGGGSNRQVSQAQRPATHPVAEEGGDGDAMPF